MSSGRDLAAAMDVSPQTAQRVLHGEPVSEETLDAAAMTLGVTVDRLRELRQEPPRQPFVLPAESERLTERQRQAVLSVVRAMLDPLAVDERPRKRPTQQDEHPAPLRVAARRQPGWPKGPPTE